MKLFVKQNKREGEAFPKDAFVSFGQMFDSRRDAYYEPNGFYIKIEMPFLRKYAKYVDPNTFDVKQGFMKKVFIVRNASA